MLAVKEAEDVDGGIGFGVARRKKKKKKQKPDYRIQKRTALLEKHDPLFI